MKDFVELPKNTHFLTAVRNMELIVERQRDLAALVAVENTTQLEALEFTLLFVKTGLRLYSLYSPQSVTRIWDELTKTDVTLDILLSMTAEYQSYNDGEIQHGVINTLSRAYSRPHETGVIPAEVTERMPARDDLNDLLTQNTWLVVVFLLNHISNSVMPRVYQKATPNSR